MKKLIIVFCLLMAGAAACSKFDEPVSGLQEETESSKADKKPQTRSIATFDTLPDPYALENMQAVYDQFDGETTLETTLEDVL